MTLERFIDNWTRSNRMVIMCESEDFDDMFDTVDLINKGEAEIEDILGYLIGAIIPHFSQLKISYYIKERWAKAEVTEFFIGDTFVIVWIKTEDNISQ